MENFENLVNAGEETVVQSQIENAGDAASEEVVDPQSTGNDTDEGAEAGNAAGEVATPHQTRDDNSKFAEIRRAKEAAEKQAADFKKESDALIQRLRGLGYTGNSASEITDEIAAQNEGIPIEDYRKREADRKAEIDNLVNSDPRVIAAEKIARDRQFAADLAAVKAAYPDVKAENISDLGEVFMRGMSSGLSPEDAYAAQLSYNSRIENAKKPTPPKIGNVKQSYEAEKDTFSADEIDRLDTVDSKLLDDPNILAKAIKSLTNK